MAGLTVLLLPFGEREPPTDLRILVGGLAMSTLLGRVRRRMLDEGIPSVLTRYHAERAG